MAELPVNRVVCGDCREIMRSWPAESVDLLIADPPYNLNQGYPFDNLNHKEYVEFNRSWLNESYRLLRKGRVGYIFNSQKTMWDFKQVLDSTPFKLIQLLIWHYPNTIPSGKKPKFAWTLSYQPIFFVSKGIPELDIYGRAFSAGLQRTDVWTFTACQSNFKADGIRKVHVSQKPTKLIEYMILSSTDENDIVLDPFLGSGTTAVACKRLNRCFVGIEIVPSYCEMARRRLSQIGRPLDAYLEV